MKVCEICGDEIGGRDGENRCDRERCQAAADKPKRKRKRKPSARDEAMRSLGMVKVRGAMGGTYWE